ncbi:MAG: hypothetical protein JW918_01420 [Anaerolineae bacterium]|nr:hypothetical protein [Anaerolineae bacterium]
MSEEQEQLPDWLLSMRGQSLEEPPIQQASVPPFPKEPPRKEAAPPSESLFESEGEPELVQEQAKQSDSDMVDLLRDMVQPDEEISYSYGKEKVSGVIPGMKPWQSLVLAGLFFLDVAVCGCMALAMLGRIGF